MDRLENKKEDSVNKFDLLRQLSDELISLSARYESFVPGTRKSQNEILVFLGKLSQVTATSLEPKPPEPSLLDAAHDLVPSLSSSRHSTIDLHEPANVDETLVTVTSQRIAEAARIAATASLSRPAAQKIELKTESKTQPKVQHSSKAINDDILKALLGLAKRKGVTQPTRRAQPKSNRFSQSPTPTVNYSNVEMTWTRSSTDSTAILKSRKRDEPQNK